MGVAAAKMELFRSFVFFNSCRLSVRSLSQSAKDYCPPVTSRVLPDGALRGKTAYVTGGGTGLGRGMAHMMSALGAQVAICSRYSVR